MKIRDIHATINKDETTITMPNGGLEIIADDGRALFDIVIHGETLEVRAGMICKHKGILLDDRLLISPRASNVIEVTRPPYE